MSTIKPFLPIDLVSLAAQSAALSVTVLSLNTRKAREHDWKLFSAWCREAGRTALPASSDTVVMYIMWCFSCGRAISTATRRAGTISTVHKEAGLPSPGCEGSGSPVNKLLRGARRDPKIRKFSRGPKAAITTIDLREISAKLISSPIFLDIRDRALVLFAFHSGMRRGEISALDLADLEFSEAGLIVTIKTSKRDQEGKGARLDIFPGEHAETCPIAAIKAWIAVRGTWEGALFCSCRPPILSLHPWHPNRRRSYEGNSESLELHYRKIQEESGGIVRRNPQLIVGTRYKLRLSAQGVSCAVKRCVAMIGKNPKLYAGHSTRRGMVTTALTSGVSEIEVMRRTRHKKLDMLARYYKPEEFASNPLGKSGL